MVFSKAMPNVKESNSASCSTSVKAGVKRLNRDNPSNSNLLENKKTKISNGNTEQNVSFLNDSNQDVDNLGEEEMENGNDKNDDSMSSKSSSSEESSTEDKNLRPILVFDVDESFKIDPNKIKDLLINSNLVNNVESVRIDAKGNLLVYGYNDLDIDTILRNKLFFPNNNKLNFNDDKFKPTVIIRGLNYETAEKNCESLALFGICNIIKFKSNNNNGSRPPFVKATLNSKAAEKEILEKGRVKIGYMSYKVEKFIKQPIQCYKCNKFGHLAKKCSNVQVCSKCSGDHSHNECVAQQLKCSNCGEAHSSFDRSCSVYKSIKNDSLKKMYSQSKHSNNSKKDMSRNFSDVASNSALVSRFDKVDENMSSLANLIKKIDIKTDTIVTDLSAGVSRLVVSNNKRMASYVTEAILLLKENDFNVTKSVERSLVNCFEKNCLADPIPLMSNHDTMVTKDKNNMYYNLSRANNKSIFRNAKPKCL